MPEIGGPPQRSGMGAIIVMKIKPDLPTPAAALVARRMADDHRRALLRLHEKATSVNGATWCQPAMP